jgi:predicted regulator of Ras-like GTPase activity (Roadblock/LC7/MglB family)
MMAQANPAGALGWLLDNLVSRIDAVRHALILSRDGLVVETSQNLSREDAEHLSAIAAGIQSLARGAAQHFRGGDVRQVIIEMDSAFLFVTSAGNGACLAVLSSAAADAGIIAYEMAMLVRRVGRHLAARPRLPKQEPATG